MMENQLASGHPPNDIDAIISAKFSIEDLGDFLRIAQGSCRPFPGIEAEVGFGGICERLEKIIIDSHVQRTLEWNLVHNQAPDSVCIRVIHDSRATLNSINKD